MKHFILTRFNETYFAINNLNPNISINDEWLANRIKIFKSITVPSVYAQTDKEFTWIVKCNPKTPTWVRKELEGEYLVCYDEFNYSYERTNAELASQYFLKTIKNITSDKEIITTRLDSDDGLANDYIEIVKKYIQVNKFLDFRRGIVKVSTSFYPKESHGLYLHLKNAGSQFCSYMEYTKDIKTVFCKTHPSITEKDAILILSQIGWLQNNHDQNMGNKLKKDRIYEHKLQDSDFHSIKKIFPFASPQWIKKNKLKLL